MSGLPSGFGTFRLRGSRDVRHCCESSSGLLSDLSGGELEFSASNEGSPQCVTVLTADDEVVESSSVFVLELALSGAPNERISIEPSQTTLTVLDNDSRFNQEFSMRKAVMYGV